MLLRLLFPLDPGAGSDLPDCHDIDLPTGPSPVNGMPESARLCSTEIEELAHEALSAVRQRLSAAEREVFDGLTWGDLTARQCRLTAQALRRAQPPHRPLFDLAAEALEMAARLGGCDE